MPMVRLMILLKLDAVFAFDFSVTMIQICSFFAVPSVVAFYLNLAR